MPSLGDLVMIAEGNGKHEIRREGRMIFEICGLREWMEQHRVSSKKGAREVIDTQIGTSYLSGHGGDGRRQVVNPMIRIARYCHCI